MGTLYKREKNVNNYNEKPHINGNMHVNAQRARKTVSDQSYSRKSFSFKKLSGTKMTLLIVFAAAAITAAILLSPLFSIREIEISKDSVIASYTEEEIREAFQDIKGKNGFAALLNNTKFSDFDMLFHSRMPVKEKSMVFDFPLIKDIEVKYNLPGKIVVKIQERTPAMMIEKDGMYLLADEEGYMLGIYTNTQETYMPIVEGVYVDEYKIGSSISNGKNIKVDNSIKICRVLKQLSMLSYIDIIDVSDYNNIRMYCAPSLTIKFGGADEIGRKLSYIKGIIDSGYDGYSNGVLDVSLGGNPVFTDNGSNDVPEPAKSPDQAAPTPGA